MVLTLLEAGKVSDTKNKQLERQFSAGLISRRSVTGVGNHVNNSRIMFLNKQILKSLNSSSFTVYNVKRFRESGEIFR